MTIKQTIEVASSAIDKAEYDNIEKALTVHFKNKTTYKYINIPEFFWRGLNESESKGRFLNSFVLGKFTFEKLK